MLVNLNTIVHPFFFLKKKEPPYPSITVLSDMEALPSINYNILFRKYIDHKKIE